VPDWDTRNVGGGVVSIYGTNKVSNWLKRILGEGEITLGKKEELFKSRLALSRVKKGDKGRGGGLGGTRYFQRATRRLLKFKKKGSQQCEENEYSLSKDRKRGGIG